MLEWIISSAVLLAAVIAVRYALRGRLRPGVQYAMWAIVLVRLLVPVSFGSGAYSAGTAAAALEQTPAVQAVLTPSMDYDAAYSQVAREYAGRGLDVSELAPRQQQAMDREIRALQRPTAVQVLQWVWLGGMAAMALTLTGTNLRLYIRLRRSRRELTREGPDAGLCDGGGGHPVPVRPGAPCRVPDAGGRRGRCDPAAQRGPRADPSAPRGSCVVAAAVRVPGSTLVRSPGIVGGGPVPAGRGAGM